MQHVIANRSSSHLSSVADFVRRIGHWVAFVRAAMMVARERRMLLQLDDRLLKDIGLGPSEAFHEASKPFGDIPSHRFPLF